MLRRSFLCCCLLAVTATAGIRDIAPPAGHGSMGSALAAAPDGSVVLSWLEPAGAEKWILKFSRFDSSVQRWGPPFTVAAGSDWFINWADFPSVTPLSATTLLAVWFVNNPSHAHGDAAGHHGTGYHAVSSTSHDAGATWSPPQPTTTESSSTEFTAVLPLGQEGRALTGWLDGRARPVQALYARHLPGGGGDVLVDPSVCDCCQLSFARVRDGALLAYRGRTKDEVRDIRIARWRDGQWEAPRLLHDDNWLIPACPVNGPRLAARGDTVAAIWFTGAGNVPRVLAKLSRDGGQSFGEPLTIDLGRPQGRVDALLLDDGTAVFSWLELTGHDAGKAGGIFIRRLPRAGKLGEPELLAPSTTARAGGFPRLIRLSDSQLLLTYTAQTGESRIATLLVDLKP